jgi:6-phosphogluconolactonase (cycloisomerase 2 family)
MRLPDARGPLLALSFTLPFLIVAVAKAQDPPPSTFAPLAGAGSCFQQPAGNDDAVLDDCLPGSGLSGAGALSVTPDQRNVYVAAGASDAIVAFGRAEDGRLEPLGCISADGGDGRFGSDGKCRDGDALVGARRVVVSPDGRFVYVLAYGSHALAWFERDPETGALEQRGCLKAQPRGGHCGGAWGLWQPSDLAIAPDGTSVYVSSPEDDSLTTFARDAETGAVVWAGCVSRSGSDGLCTDATGMDGAASIAIAPDGATVFLTAGRAGALDWFARDRATGLLTQSGCLRETPVKGGSCTQSTDVAQIADVLAAPDGNTIYAATRSSLVEFRRSDDGSALERVACTENVAPHGDDAVDPGDDDEGEEEDDEDWDDEEDEEELMDAGGCAPAKALDWVGQLAITPDARTLVATGADLTAFARDEGGGLRQLGCAQYYLTYRSCLQSDRVRGVSWAEVSPDGRTMYVTSASGVSGYTLAAAVASARATVAARRPVALRVGCPRRKRRACAVRVRFGGTASHARRPAVRIAAGRYATLRVAVPRALRRAVRARGRLRATVRLRDRSTRTKVIRRSVVLRAAR